MISEYLQKLHENFKISAIRYRKTQAKLIDYAQKADREKLYLHLGYGSLFEYLVKGLGLSESTASNVSCVARVAVKAPQIKEELNKGLLGIAKIRKFCPALQKASEEEIITKAAAWLEKAKTMSTRELENEVAKVSEAPRRKDSLRKTGQNNNHFSADFTDEDRTALERLTDIVSQKKKSCLSISESLMVVVREYIERYDPQKKAAREQERKEKKSTQDSSVTEPTEKSGRQTIPSAIVHEVNRRDGGQCTYTGPDGNRCECNRFLHFHHIKPVSRGGKNTAENLITLCAAHHSLIHEERN
jgi:5-methylcytosine-specific restriction endonuclease McrA